MGFRNGLYVSVQEDEKVGDATRRDVSCQDQATLLTRWPSPDTGLLPTRHRILLRSTYLT